MNEITRIHLAKTPYDIEITAKKALDKYFQTLASFQADQEIVSDIEARMTEILLERGVAKNGVISSDDVAALEKQLGKPEDFMADEAGSLQENQQAVSGDRKLFRDGDRAVLGGVLAGIGVYFGVNPIWLRLAFIVSIFITGGLSILMYILFWIIVPPVRTVADKLQLRGQAVTVASMRQLSETEGPVDQSHDQRVAKVLTTLCGVGFVLAALGAFAATVAGGVGILYRGNYLDSRTWLADHLTLGYWLFGLAVAGGLLLTCLFSLAAYACFSRRLTKRIAISSSIIILAGLACAGAFAVIGLNVAQLNQASIARNTSVSELAMTSDQSQPTSLRVEGDQAGILVQYEVSDQPLHASFKSWHEDDTDTTQTPRLSLKAGVLSLEVPKQPVVAWYVQPEVTIYGPALDRLAFQKVQGSVGYRANRQAKLTADVGSGRLTLSGQIDQLNANVGQNGVLDASDASVQVVKSSLANGVELALGAIKNLDLTTREVCANDQTTSVSIGALTSSQMTLNGKHVTAGSLQTACTNITIDDDTDTGQYHE